MLDAHAKDVDLDEYRDVRSYEGFRSHEEALEVCLAGIPWERYVSATRALYPASHAEVVKALLDSPDREDWED
ncbi:hypothetical protein SAMN06265355_102200 [Actinomadura mexicana]|uniref:Uncharacterized protein n=1 Tax=Actinomadura mexicana TaxID=134959 RepID=A0A238VRJ4_9ACTN|nr:hypothetical protein SAMN06265355_102200 [Actinomadura mexicana]